MKTTLPQAARRSVNRQNTQLISRKIPLYFGLITLTMPVMVQAADTSIAAPSEIAVAQHNFSIPRQPLYSALNALAEQAKVQFIFTEEMVQGLSSAGVSGQLSTQAALKKVLEGSGLQYRVNNGNTITLEKKIGDVSSQIDALPAVKVTGKAEHEANSYSSKLTNSRTATKTDVALMDAPVTMQVVPQQVLKDQQAVTLEDAAKNVSGVQRVWTSGGIGQDFVIRGFGSNYTRFRNGKRISYFNTDMANVEQVEILKGPSAMLYGRVEPGGLVNVVTKKPQDDAHYSLQQQFGSYDFYRTVAEATGPLTDDKSLTYRMDFGYTDRNSFRDFVSQEQIFVAPALHWQATEKTEFNLNIEYTDRKLPYDTGLPAVGNRVANVPINTNYGQPGQKFNQGPSDSILLDFDWSHAFNDNWKFSNGFTGNWVNTQSSDILVAVAQPLLNNGNNSQVRRGSWFYNNTDDTYSTFFNINGKLKTGDLSHNLLIGGDYFRSEYKGSGFFGYNAINAPANSPYHMPSDFAGGGLAFTRVNLYNPVYPSLNYSVYDNLRNNQPNDFFIKNTSWYGVYFQDQIGLFDDKLQILGGGRYDWVNNSTGNSNSTWEFAEDANGNYNGYVPSFDKINLAKQNVGYFSPRVGLLYRPWSWLSVYGNRIEGLGANNGRSATGQALKPETSEQYEAGVKGEWFDGDLTANMAYFHIDKKNVLTLVREGGIYDTIGAARSQGIEVDVAGQLSDGLSLITSYAYTDARITDDGVGSNQGHRLPNVAEHSGSAWLKYAFQQSSLKGLSLGVGTYLAGKREGDNKNSYQLPGYVRVDTFAGYTMDVGPTKLTTQLNVNNIFDKRYFYAGEPYNANRAWNMPGDPLTVMGVIKVEY
jgi:iron complex outermembrane receptor protein